MFIEERIYGIRKNKLRLVIRLLMITSLFLLTIKPLLSQTPILDRKVSFTEQTTTVRELLSELSKAGGFTFSYGKEVPLDKQIHVTDKSQSIRTHLDEIFLGDSLSYIEKSKKILIVPSHQSTPKVIPQQIIKGRIVDLDSKMPLVGVNVVLGSEGPLTGAVTDEQGYFRFEEVPIGRHDLQCSYVGFEPQNISNFLVTSGKEQVINLEMEESVIILKEVKVLSRDYQSKPINELTVVSGRSFSAYEVENIPGSLSDISRAALSFPGVVTTNDGQNHMVIRGNSPKGLQWRLEGIELPNLNHFAEVGSSGGGVNVISNNMLASSDFLTGAFPAEYGNALSGVFDLRLRTGNNEKHEQTIQVGLIGTEVMVEGPLSKSSNTTYIAQYRYSTLKLIQKLGAKLQSVPDFQDLSFKIYHPTEKMGVFSLFGIGGLSHEEGESGYVWNSNMATVGVSNIYSFDPKTFIKSVIAFSGRNYTWDDEYNKGTTETPFNQIWNTDITDYTVKGSFTFNRKINSKHKLKAGIIYEMAYNDSYMGWYSDTLYNWYSDPDHPEFGNQEFTNSLVNSKENAATLQTYLNWKYRITEGLTLNTGAHFLQFYLNNNYSIEPRVSMQWEMHPRHILSAGFGIHSRKESMTFYTGEKTLFDGAVIQPNIDLELSKAQHYVLGYHFLISDYIHLKAEAYYQHMYDIPAYPFPPYFSSINFDYGFEGNVLTNYGTAYNKGIEMTLEKYLSKGYHFILNGTLYDSKYKTKTGELLHTKYDGSYASNGLIGREFKVGKGKQNSIAISTRYILIGGMRYLPINREQSLAEGQQVRYWDDGYSEKADDYFRIDLQFKFRRNKPRYTAEWSIDLMNITNRENMLVEYWDSSIRDYRIEYQNPILAFLNYRIQF
jgi:hypothetical protein